MIRTLLPALTLILTACAASTPNPSVTDASPTPRPTPTAPLVAATRTPQPGFTLIPASPLPPTDTPVPCTNDAVFISDITIPDNTAVAPGGFIDKRWEVENRGTCNWNRDYRVAFFEGSQMGAAGEHALFPAKAGARAIVQINMIAPDVPGEYTGRWQLRDPNGQPFGQVLFIKIVVTAPPAPSP